ncbi:MAG: prepilin-type N-terminal cleavage/methylation domain-containing protein [Thermodesulfobacteriota bacterium]
MSGIKGGYEQGFTLIEVLVAMVVLLIGVLGWVGFSWTTTKGTSYSRELNRATFLAQSRMENLKQIGLSLDSQKLPLRDDGNTNDLMEINAPDHINADPNTVNSAQTNLAINAEGQTGQPDSIYFLMWNIADNCPVQGAKTLSVIVRWRSQLDGNNHQVFLQTIL